MSRSCSAFARSTRGVASILVLGSIAPAFAAGQDPARPGVSADRPTPIASTRSGGTISAGSASQVKASAKVDGTPSPGLQVTLDGSGSSGGRIWFRWLQTQGPKVTLDDPTGREARFTVPSEGSALGFVLVVGNASGVDAKAVTIEVEDPERDAVDQSLKADAGDDQAARVGRKVVLNGVRSEPRGKIRYRWVQAGGPKALLKANEGPTATFQPAVAGTYRFALVVASAGGVISEPSTVEVVVGGTIRASVDPSSMAIDELARASIASIEGGPRLADDLARAFDAAADGVAAAGSRNFAEAIADTTRRLDAVVPREKERRAVWIDQLFAPLMSRLVASLKDDGLDIAQPGAQAKTLTREQKARLAEQLRFAAAGLRASRATR